MPERCDPVGAVILNGSLRSLEFNAVGIQRFGVRRLDGALQRCSYLSAYKNYDFDLVMHCF
jgi:hypothetical protein